MRLTAAPAAGCTGCGQQKTDRKHVDFEAAFDGPVINQEDVIVRGMTAMQIDDLVLCENCVQRAVEILALEELPPEKRRGLEDKVAELETMNAGQRRYIEQLERTVAAKPAPPVRRRQPTRT